MCISLIADWADGARAALAAGGGAGGLAGGGGGGGGCQEYRGDDYYGSICHTSGALPTLL